MSYDEGGASGALGLNIDLMCEVLHVRANSSLIVLRELMRSLVYASPPTAPTTTNNN